MSGMISLRIMSQPKEAKVTKASKARAKGGQGGKGKGKGNGKGKLFWERQRPF